MRYDTDVAESYCHGRRSPGEAITVVEEMDRERVPLVQEGRITAHTFEMDNTTSLQQINHMLLVWKLVRALQRALLPRLAGQELATLCP